MNVSIIIPVYNGEKSIKRAILSAITQNNQRVQVIIVNDGSSDLTEQICTQLAESYTDIVFLSQTNKGVSAARNLGLQKAVGKYIAFLDADDVLKSDFCDAMITISEKENSDMVLCGYENISENNFDLWIPRKETDVKKIVSDMIDRGGINMLWNKLFLREKITENFNIAKNMGEDLEFISNYLKNTQTISIVQKSLYCYYKDNYKSLTHTICISPSILLYEYSSLMQIINIFNLCENDLRDRLVFRTCDQFMNLDYRMYIIKWKEIRQLSDFDKLISTYNPNKKIYKIISYLISKNKPLPVYFLMKMKFLKSKIKIR